MPQTATIVSAFRAARAQANTEWRRTGGSASTTTTRDDEDGDEDVEETFEARDEPASRVLSTGASDDDDDDDKERPQKRAKPDNLTDEQEDEWERAVKRRKFADETLNRIEAAARQKAAEQDVVDRFLHRPVLATPTPVDSYDGGRKSGLYFNIPCVVEGGAFNKLKGDTFNGKLGETWRGWEARAREHGNGDMGYENLHWVPDPTPCSNEKDEDRFLKSAEGHALSLLTEQGYKRTGSTREDFTFPTAEERKTKTLEAMQTAMNFWCEWRTQSGA